jgi:hypothetical protein
MLVTTVVLFTAARVLLSAGRVPVGALTLLFGLTALLVSAAFDEDAEGVLAALLAGAVLDAALRGHRTGHTARTAAAFGIASAVLWLAYFGLLESIDGIQWQAEVWLGAIVLSTLCAAAIPTLTSPAPTTQQEDRP